MIAEICDHIEMQEQPNHIAVLQFCFNRIGANRYIKAEVLSPSGHSCGTQYEDIAKAVRVLWRMVVHGSSASNVEAHDDAERDAVTPYEVEDQEGEDLIEEVRAKYGRTHLRTWAWSILATKAEDMPLMVAEDPSVMHVVAAYLREVEGRPRRAKKKDTP
jgi:hypothetical protein